MKLCQNSHCLFVDPWRTIVLSVSEAKKSATELRPLKDVKGFFGFFPVHSKCGGFAMNLTSEKEFYSGQLEEVAVRFNAEYFLWGEELIDRKLILYAKKLKQIKGYEKIRGALEPCGLVFVDFRKDHFLSCVTAMLDMENGNVYFTEESFNGTWKQLKRSIVLGIRIAGDKGLPCSITKPEDIVVLDHLTREGSTPHIKNDVIRYQSRQPTEEERRVQSRRQSLLDNPKMNFYYSKDGRYYHDKECPLVKEIDADQFCASENIPDGKEMCLYCRRQIYFRKACAPNVKQAPICDRIFKNHRVSVEKIEYCVMKAGMKFHAAALDEMQIEGADDRWIVKGLNTDRLSLWHNNYVKTSETERYITQGYHKQNLEGKNLTQILRYVESYSWEKHLQRQAEPGAEMPTGTSGRFGGVNGNAEIGKEKVQAAGPQRPEKPEYETRKPWYRRAVKWVLSRCAAWKNQ